MWGRYVLLDSHSTEISMRMADMRRKIEAFGEGVGDEELHGKLLGKMSMNA